MKGQKLCRYETESGSIALVYGPRDFDVLTPGTMASE